MAAVNLCRGEMRFFNELKIAYSLEKEQFLKVIVSAWEKEKEDYYKATANIVHREFIVDHIIPIAIGGAEFDLDNKQYICDVCNKTKTAKDAADIAKFRKKVKAIDGNTTLTNFIVT